MNYRIVITNAHHNYIISAQYNFISNNSFFEERDKKENVAVTGAAATSC
jgi:hypothetical protein